MSTAPWQPDIRQASPGPLSAAGAIARVLVRQAWNATLATLVAEGGHPYGSLVAIATEPDGTPLLLLSGLAVHTRNIKADQRASLMIDGTGGGQEALTGARVSLVGEIAPVRSSATARRRYLARHPNAERFIDFEDFDLYTLDVRWAHLVTGFGRIERLARGDVVLQTAGAESLLAAEPDIAAHMNTDHVDTLPVLAAAFAANGSPACLENSGNPLTWAMTGCDPEGLDLASGDHAVRIVFPQRVNTPDELRAALVGMVTSARKLKR